MTKTMISAAALVAAAAGMASQADAGRYYLTAGSDLYTAGFGGAVQSASLGLNSGARSPAIAFNSAGRLFAAVTQGNGSADLYEISNFGPGAFAPSVAFVSDLASATNSFDFRGTGANERLIGTRNASGSARYFESTSSAFTAFADAANATGIGGGGSFPSTAFDGSVYWAITNGASAANRSILTVDIGTGIATDTGMNLTFAAGGNALYGNIQLAGGDFAAGDYYLSFYSNALDMAVIGTVDLTNGMFTEVDRVDVGGVQPQSMGLAIIIPTPLAGGMSAAGLFVLGARRRRNG